MTYPLTDSPTRLPSEKEVKQALGLDDSSEVQENRRKKAWQEFQDRVEAEKATKPRR
ncbi:MAG: hypothetical protein AAF399_07880 [Bacteroidota bacterium]